MRDPSPSFRHTAAAAVPRAVRAPVEPPLAEDVIVHADTLRFESGLVLPVINIEKLIRAKELSGRKKDTEVLHELRALRALKLAREGGLSELMPEPAPEGETPG